MKLNPIFMNMIALKLEFLNSLFQISELETFDEAWNLSSDLMILEISRSVYFCYNYLCSLTTLTGDRSSSTNWRGTLRNWWWNKLKWKKIELVIFPWIRAWNDNKFRCLYIDFDENPDPTRWLQSLGILQNA